MKSKFYLIPKGVPLCLLLSVMGLLSFSPLFAQNYNAGVGSGTGGSLNVFLGTSAGRITTGSSNSFMGHNAGYSNTTGNQNLFLGATAGYSNTTSSNNSFVGFAAGYTNTTGKGNSFVGNKTGYSNTTGNDNSFIGDNAGNSNTTGYSNSFVGSLAGYLNTTGSGNSFLGTGAGRFNTTGYSNSFLGSLAGYANTTGSNNSFVGIGAGYSNTTGHSNSFLGINAGYSNTTGNNNSFIGNYANTSNGTLSNANAFGARSYVSTSNSLVLGAISGVNGATTSTKVGIGTSAPAYLFHVNGDAAKPGTSTWTIASDRRLKKNVSSFNEGLDILTQIRPVWFQYNGEAGMPTQKTYVGVIAQEMQKIAPYMVGTFTYQDTTGKQSEYLDYDANALTYVLVNSIKEQQAQLEELRQENAQMKKDLAQIRALLLDKKEVAVTESEVEHRLFQNEPNPTDGTTIIRYHIPRQASQAQIKLYSVKGEQLNSFLILQRGAGQLSLNTTTLPTGVYLYRLFIDGKPVDAKKLLLNR